MGQIIELAGHLTPWDKRVSGYKLLAFDVPEGIARLDVDYSFSEEGTGHLGGAPRNILDIGIFDPRGSEFLQAQGFRGWSGSARRTFSLSRDEATPGYLPGPILPGCWEIILGLYRILPEGCDYRVSIRLFEGPSPSKEFVPPPPGPVLNRRSGWFRGDLHCHTHHSDGTGSLADLVTAAHAQRLDFVAVTDHNTVSHLAHLPAYSGAGLLLVPGVELTTEYGHANAWGIERWHDFRCESPAQMAAVVADVKSTGALISINHPKDGGPPWTYGGEDAYDCVEVWQAPWGPLNYQSLGLWDRLLRAGHRITAVGGSDVHQAPLDGDRGSAAVGLPCTWVYARELSTAGLLAGIKAGHVFISELPSGPRISLWATTLDGPRKAALMGDELRVSPGTRVRLCCVVEDAEGCVLRLRSSESEEVTSITTNPFRHECETRVDQDTFMRVEVISPTSQAPPVRALSNPVYLRLD
ncbi:MAG: CehA/McbA family metallohydrolase [Anaerolineae bacterium]